MKKLHRRDLFSWSVFSERLDIDFNAYCWTRPDGNVLIDPLAMTPHDREHLERLGGAAWIVLTNSAHVRGATELAAALGANVAGPAGRRTPSRSRSIAGSETARSCFPARPSTSSTAPRRRASSCSSSATRSFPGTSFAPIVPAP